MKKARQVGRTRFADTGFYVAVLNPDDALHARALASAAVPGLRIVTTEFVLIEVANFFSRPGGRDLYNRLLADIRLDTRTELVPATSDLFDQGNALYAARPDKEWSLTDCTSFVVMEQFKLTEALTADHHFTQAGFAALLA